MGVGLVPRGLRARMGYTHTSGIAEQEKITKVEMSWAPLRKRG